MFISIFILLTYVTNIIFVIYNWKLLSSCIFCIHFEFQWSLYIY